MATMKSLVRRFGVNGARTLSTSMGKMAGSGLRRNRPAPSAGRGARVKGVEVKARRIKWAS